MKKGFLLFSSVFAVVLLFAACRDKLSQLVLDNVETWRLKSVTSYSDRTANAAAGIAKTYLYDSQGRLSRIDYALGATITSYDDYEYANGKVTRIRNYVRNSAGIYENTAIYAYTYQANGDTLKAVIAYPLTLKNGYATYSYTGGLLKRVDRFENDTLSASVTYEYLDARRLSRAATYNNKSALLTYTENSWTDRRLDRTAVYRASVSSGTAQKERDITYEYDDHGRLSLLESSDPRTPPLSAAFILRFQYY